MQDEWDELDGDDLDDLDELLVEIDCEDRPVSVHTSASAERDWHTSEPFRDIALWLQKTSGNVRWRRLSAEDLRAMREWDFACYFEELEYACEMSDCEAWHDPENGGHESCCPWRSTVGHEQWEYGLVLHRRDRKFWERLRKLGATPEVVAAANALLHPEAPKVQRAGTLRQPICAVRRRGARARGAGRPRAQASRSSARSGDSGDDDGPSPPLPELGLWQHPHHGPCSPDLLRVLLAVEREEAGR